MYVSVPGRWTCDELVMVVMADWPLFNRRLPDIESSAPYMMVGRVAIASGRGGKLLRVSQGYTVPRCCPVSRFVTKQAVDRTKTGEGIIWLPKYNATFKPHTCRICCLETCEFFKGSY